MTGTARKYRAEEYTERYCLNVVQKLKEVDEKDEEHPQRNTENSVAAEDKEKKRNRIGTDIQ